MWGFDIDEHPRNAKRAIGIVPQEILFDPFFTPREALEIQAGMYGIAKPDRITDQLLAAVRLTDKADAYARTLSGGNEAAAAGGQGDGPFAPRAGARRADRRESTSSFASNCGIMCGS